MAYFSNSSEGGWFDEGCEDCLHEDPDYGCPIAFIQMNYNYDQCNNDKVKEILDFLVSQKKGCILRDKIIAMKTGPKPDRETVAIFEKNSSFGPRPRGIDMDLVKKRHGINQMYINRVFCPECDTHLDYNFNYCLVCGLEFCPF